MQEARWSLSLHYDVLSVYQTLFVSKSSGAYGSAWTNKSMFSCSALEMKVHNESTHLLPSFVTRQPLVAVHHHFIPCIEVVTDGLHFGKTKKGHIQKPHSK